MCSTTWGEKDERIESFTLEPNLGCFLKTIKLLFSRVTVGQSEEVWVKPQTLHRIISAQMTHLLRQQQPADKEDEEMCVVTCAVWQTRVGVKAKSASVSAYRSLDRSTDRPRSFANSSAVSEPLSDTCAGRIQDEKRNEKNKVIHVWLFYARAF